MSADAEQRKRAAIIFTTWSTYSTLSQRDDKLALELLARTPAVVPRNFPRFNGTEIKNIGDAFFVERKLC